MSTIKSVIMILFFSVCTEAAEISFSPLRLSEITSSKDITNQEKVLSVDGVDSNFIIKTKSSTIVVPLINEQEVSRAIDDFKYSGKDIFCTITTDTKNCENLNISFAFRIERTKIFPAYYKKIESHCKSKSSEMLYGAIGYTGGYRLNPIFALSTGESASSRGLLGLRIFKEGQLVKTIGITDEEKIVFLNNTNPLNLDVWVHMDESRNTAVLLDGQTCKPVGEVVYN